MLKGGTCVSASALVILLLVAGAWAQNGTNTGVADCSLISNCDTCHNPDRQCAACNSGWVGNGTSQCFECPDYCTSCRALSDRATCDTCFPFFYEAEEGRKCERCVGLCAECSERDQCDVCVAGSRLLDPTGGSTIECGSCPSNCNACGSTTECWECRDGDEDVESDVGYYLNLDLCSACPVRCLKCSEAGTCAQCHKGYRFDPTSNICVSCIANCETCASETTCTKCDPGYSVAPDGESCLACVFCDDCAASGGCTSCMEGYYASFEDVTCTACDDTNCKMCSESEQCSECEMGWTLLEVDGDPDKCIACPDLEVSSTCESCDGSNRDRYFISDTNTCGWCPQFCSDCDAIDTCDTCAYGYYKVNTTVDGVSVDSCLSCAGEITNCADCPMASECSQCDMYSYQASVATCTLCSSSIDNCIACSSASACSECAPGFYIDGTGCEACPSTLDDLNSQSICVTQCGAGLDPGKYWTEACVDCPDNCAECTDVDGAPSCTECHPEFMVEDGACVDCPDNCLMCETVGGAASCTLCMDEYGVQTGACVDCEDDGCKTCADPATCTACKTDYLLIGTSCYSTSCDAGQGPDAAGSTTCAACNATCATCFGATDADKCTTCFHGTYLIDTAGVGFGNCAECDPVCGSCTGAGPTMCSSCVVGMYLDDDNMCVDCDSSCINCNAASADNCTACPAGTFLNDPGSVGYGTCDACTFPCVTCDGPGQESCLSCAHHASTDNATVCLECDFPCESCEQTDTSMCVSCYDGFFLENGNCTKCLPQCLTCVDGMECTSCAEETFTTPDCVVAVDCTTTECPAVGCFGDAGSNCTGACHSSCLGECELQVESTCYVCADGFFVELEVVGDASGFCRQCTDPSCKTCDPTADCLSCYDGYYLDNGDCTRCPSPCYKCDDASTCTACPPGYHIDGTTCIRSPGENCTTATDCSACYPGSFLNVDSCDACDRGCASCMGSADNCDMCITGFYLDGTECLPCNPMCTECMTDATTCTACPEGTALDTDECGCHMTCDTCVGLAEDDCLVCVSGFSKVDGDTSTKGTCMASCADGEYNNGTACTDCGTDCATCTEGPSGNSQNCATCGSGKYLTTENNCEDCPTSEFSMYNCPRCATTVGKTWITPCNDCPTNCLSCTRAGNGDIDCTSCKSGFYLAGETGKRNCSTAVSCDVVETADECAACSTTLRPRQWQTRDGETACYYKPAHCMTMDDGVCTTCEAGYQIVDYVHGFTECGVCSLSDMECTQCGRAIRSNYGDTQYAICLQCPQKCLVCGNDGTCTTCVSGYYPNTDGTECLQCGANCKTCVDNAVCSVCYSPDDGNFGHHALVTTETTAVCEECASNCVSCSESNICITCMEGYPALVETRNEANELTSAVCQACGSNCNACTSSTFCNANSCDDYYYRSATGDEAECIRCTHEQCITCSGANTCTECNIGYYVDANSCQRCMDGCNACNDGTTCIDFECQAGYCYNTDTSVCLATNNLCTYCNENGGCLDCGANSFLEICKACVDNHCLECNDPVDSSTVDFCTKCSTGFYAKDGDCLPCNDNCDCDTEADKCTECLPGNFVLVDNDCIACITIHHACIACSDETTCTECSEGFGADGGTCHECGENCKSDCDAAAPCKSCISDSYYETVTDDCRACGLAITGCLTCSDENTCTSCAAGYGLSAGSCIACGANCMDTCDSDDSCKECTSFAYYKAASGDRCIDCGPRCTTCESDGSSCTACMEGAFLMTTGGVTTCEPCSEGCAMCSSLAVCDRCHHPQYTLVDGSEDGSRVCAECDIEGCAQCTGTQTDVSLSCVMCNTGRYLTEDKQCARCSDAVTDCAVCNDHDFNFEIAVSECEACPPGYYLPEGSDGCIACDITGCSVCEDQPLICDKCDKNYQATPDQEECLGACYVCRGNEMECDFDDRDSFPTEVCRNPEKSSCFFQRNTTFNDFDLKVVTITAGCMPDSTGCAGPALCHRVGNLESCVSCCDGHLCNTHLGATAATMVTSLATTLLVAAIAVLLERL